MEEGGNTVKHRTSTITERDRKGGYWFRAVCSCGEQGISPVNNPDEARRKLAAFERTHRRVRELTGQN